MNLTAKSPISNPSQIEAIIKEERIKYIEGAPLSYRLKCNADGGRLNFEGIDDANFTKKGEPFSFCPIAYRAYNNRKFGREKSGTWVEVFFLNEKGQMCMLMFNNASAENFLNVAKLLEYEDLDVSQTRFKCSLKTKSNAEAKTDYYICFFEYEELKNEDRLLHQFAIESLPDIYRRDTLDTHDSIISYFNYPLKFIRCCNTYTPQIGSSNSIIADFEEVEELPPSEAGTQRVLSAGRKNK